MRDEGRSPVTDDPRQLLQDKILSDHPRLAPDDAFTFSCHPGVSCFNTCCSDVNIFLAPYDILRLKRRLGITSTEFLEKYVLLPVQRDMKTPAVLLRMNEEEGKRCFFLAGQGCGVYPDRPWPCRMYPVGLAASKDTPDGWRGERFYFLLQEEGCKGFGEAKSYTIREWLDDQEVGEYDEWGEAFKELALHDFFEKGNVLTPEKMEMFYTATYDLDRFRKFVFETSLLDRFEMDEDYVEEMRYNDEALLRFGFLWARFALFGEPTMKVKKAVMESFLRKMEKKTPAEP